MNPVETNLAILNDIVQFAYAQGYHEVGYDIVGEIQQHIAGLDGDLRMVRSGRDTFKALHCSLQQRVVERWRK